MSFKEFIKGTGKFFIIFFAFLLVASFFVAADYIPNPKEYDTNTKTATINELITGTKIADIKLESPLMVYAIAGKDRYVGEITINQVKETPDFFKSIELIDQNTGKKITREIKFKQKKIIQTIQQNYETICDDKVQIINATDGRSYQDIKACSTKEIASTIIENPKWTDYDISNGLEKFCPR